MYQSCADERERAKQEARLYAPPREVAAQRRAEGRAVMPVMDAAAAAALVADAEREDAARAR